MSVDERVMNELVGRKIPIEDFEEEIGKVLKQKSSAKLLISNKRDMIKGADGEFHAVNFKCIPQSASFETSTRLKSRDSRTPRKGST